MDRRTLFAALPATMLGSLAGTVRAEAQAPSQSGPQWHIAYRPARRARITHRYSVRFGNPDFVASA